jgi:hypothetical protein
MGAKPASHARVGPDAAVPPDVSFLDRVLSSIGRLPFGGWWLYLALAGVAGAWLTIIRWMTGVAPLGQIDFAVLTPLAFGPYALAMIHYLDDFAGIAVKQFAPALGNDAVQVERWRWQLTRLPSRPAAAAAAVGFLIGFVVLVGTPPSIYLRYSNDLVTTALLAGWVVVFGFVVLILLFYHTWRQLRAVRAVHAAATRIDPFDPSALFAFSGLTARTGLGYLVVLYYSLTLNGEFTTSEPTILVFEGLVGIAALACFVLPLLGMHGRLAAVKANLLSEVESSTRRVTAELFRLVDEGRLTALGELNDTIGSLTVVRDSITRLRTWPWSPGLFRGFLSLVLLPIAVWFITWILDRVLKV